MENQLIEQDSEIVIGLVAPIGVNLDDVHNRLTSFLKQFKYSINYIHLSEIAKQYQNQDEPGVEEHIRLNNAMTNGNNLREKTKRNDIYALLAITKIQEMRTKSGNPQPLQRTAHIIRSLKHPEEAETLRQVYGQGFFLLGVSASIANKKKFLKDEKGVPEEEITKLIERDDKEKNEFGQSTRDVFQIADAFITTDDHKSLSNQLSRIIDILYSKPVYTPTPDEYAMFMAYAASLRSGDLSRQVGAVILNKDLDIISTGANDVPKFGGGLYWPSENDQRDHILGEDSNEIRKNDIILKIMKKIKATESLIECSDEELLKDGKYLLKDTGILDITEYGRSVHAEMEAIISSARNGVSTRDATLYTTTYPCHNCAKHIIATGIRKVVYIEPYPKSYAIALHSDSIDAVGEANSSKVAFTPFVGIGPRRFIDLFSMSLGNGRKLIRKENGKLAQWSRGATNLRLPMNPLSYIEAESALVIEFEKSLNHPSPQQESENETHQ